MKLEIVVDNSVSSRISRSMHTNNVALSLGGVVLSVILEDCLRRSLPVPERHKY